MIDPTQPEWTCCICLYVTPFREDMSVEDREQLEGETGLLTMVGGYLVCLHHLSYVSTGEFSSLLGRVRKGATG